MEADFNKIIEIKEREAYRAMLFMEQIDQREKTLVFCASQLHALAVRDPHHQMKTSKEPNYCQRVTSDDGELGDQTCATFRTRKDHPDHPHHVQSFDRRDAPHIRNIVLCARSTRSSSSSRSSARHTTLRRKDYFTIYDFVKAYSTSAIGMGR